MKMILAVAAVLSVLSPVLRAETYDIDSSQSQVGFRVKHLVGKVPGRFTKFSGTIDFTPGKPELWKVDATIDPSTINTDNEKRDGHLKSPDFFDTAKFPAMSFKSTKVTDVKGDSAKLLGNQDGLQTFTRGIHRRRYPCGPPADNNQIIHIPICLPIG